MRTGLGAVEPTAVSKNESEASEKAVAAMRDIFIDESLNLIDVVADTGCNQGFLIISHDKSTFFAAAEFAGRLD